MQTGQFLVMASLMALSCSGPKIQPEPLPAAAEHGVLLAAVAKSQSIDLSRPLSTDALSAIAVLANPDLKSFRTQEGVAEAQVFAAGLIADPSFSLGVDRALNGSGLVTALATAVGLDIAGMIRRPAAVRGARSTLAAVRQDIVWAEWLTGEQARLQGTRVAHLEQILTLTRSLKELTEQSLSVALRAVARGDLSAAELEARRLAEADASDRYRTTESQLAAARIELNRTLGLDSDEKIAVAIGVAVHAEPPSAAELFVQAVANRADLAGMREGYRASGASLRAASLNRYPLPTVDVHYARDTGDLKTLGAAVGFSIPIWNRGKGEIALAQANREQLRSAYAARLEAIRNDVASARTALRLADVQHAELRKELVPLLEHADAVDRAAKRGDLALAVAAATRMTLLDKQIVAAGLSQAAAETRIILEIASGNRLESTP